jgi:dihydropteroate synthase-like protein
MKILLITGKLATESIKEQTKNLMHEVDVLTLPVTVAAFITPEYAAKQLAKMELADYDMILLPGSVNGDVSPVEKATGIPTYKSTLHASDLPVVLSMDIEFSKTIPASLLVKDALVKQAENEVLDVEKNWKDILSTHGGMVIGGKLPVSNGLPMRILAEIVNAPTLSMDAIRSRALYYASQGADLIDIGMLASNPKPEAIPKIIDTIREAVDLPVSIDTLNVEEIKSSIDAGIDLILSLDAGNLDEIAPHINDEAVVILSTNMKEGYLPKKAEERVTLIFKIIDDARSLGINNIIGDLVVEPLLIPGLLEGLKAYDLFHQKYPETPLLFGIGNAVELIDADSPGVIAALSALAREAGSNMLHIPEYSVKAKGSVRNALRASHMMFLSEKRGTVLKDLGIDLLLMKEKRWIEHEYSLEENTVDVLQGIGETVYKPDKTGWFNVHVNRNENKIVAVFYLAGSKEPSAVIKGDDARVVYQTIIREKLITKLDHAAYLGKELEKAAIALKLGRSYVQDEQLF